MEIVCNNPDIPWDWRAISENPNITMEIICNNLHIPWNPNAICRNPFKFEKEQFELRVRHQKFIQENVFEELVKYAYHPKRIMKYLEMEYEPHELDEVM